MSRIVSVASVICCLAALGCNGTATGSTGSTGEGPKVPGTDGTGSAAAPGAKRFEKQGTAPDFTLPTLQGETVSLSDYQGKVVLIDFWATWCDPCLQEMPELVHLYEEKKDQGFEILAVSIDGPETAAQVSTVVQQKKMPFPILLDEESTVVERYNPKVRLPYTAVLDREGSILLKRAGYQPGDAKSWQTLVDAVDQALADK